jgi:hypothetical protein
MPELLARRHSHFQKILATDLGASPTIVTTAEALLSFEGFVPSSLRMRRMCSFMVESHRTWLL